MENERDEQEDYLESFSPFSTPESTSTAPTSVDLNDSEQSWPSPAPSVYSVTESIIAQSFRDEHGRKLNSYSNIYRLPADDEEITRLRMLCLAFRQIRSSKTDSQEINTICSMLFTVFTPASKFSPSAFQEIMGRYPPGLHDVLSDDPGVNKAVLDLGCGCGTWIMDLAREFPRVKAVGVDLVPMQAADMPQNCRSEIDDINLGLEHFYGEFDVVHARLIASGIRDYARLVDQVAQVVRPNGLVSFLEWDFRVYDSKKNVLTGTEIDPAPSHVARFCVAVSVAARARGGSVDAANLLTQWCLEHDAFDTGTVHQADYWLPASPWCTDSGSEGDRLREWGKAMRENSLIFINGARPLLLGHGLPLEQVDELVLNAQRELIEARLQLWSRTQRVTARRRI